MKIRKKELIYDISNLAFIIADTGVCNTHGEHRITDICEDGNIDRVARIAGLAYLKAMDTISPILDPATLSGCRDITAHLRDYILPFKAGISLQKRVSIRETVREYMVCSVIADHLSFIGHEGWQHWKAKADYCLSSLAMTGAASSGYFKRRIAWG